MEDILATLSNIAAHLDIPLCIFYNEGISLHCITLHCKRHHQYKLSRPKIRMILEPGHPRWQQIKHKGASVGQ